MTRRIRNLILVCAAAAVAAALLMLGVRLLLVGDAEKVQRNEAELLLSYVADDMDATVQYRLNGARHLAEMMAFSPLDAEQFYTISSTYIDNNEGALAAMLVSSEHVLATYPADAGLPDGAALSELPYVFNMARLCGGTVVEGPSEYFSIGTPCFLFSYPLYNESDAYIAQAVVFWDENYVLDAFGLNRLTENGYDYELWYVDLGTGNKVTIETSNSSVDYTQGLSATLSLPSEWTIDIVPSGGWATSSMNGLIDAAIIIVACCVVVLVLIAVLYRERRRSAFVDRPSGLPNRRGFEQQVDRLISGGEHAVALVFVLIDDFDRIVQHDDALDVHARLAAVQERLQNTISSQYVLGRASEGSFLIAVADDMSEHELDDLAKRLSIEFIWKTEQDGRKMFQGVAYGATRFPQDADNAHELVAKAVRRCYERMDGESPVLALTEKCRRLAEGDSTVEFESYIDTDMMRLSESISQYRTRVDQLVYRDPTFGVGNRSKYLRDTEAMIEFDRKRPFTLYCVDIRSFSRYNELFGVQVGDMILREASLCLQRVFGENLYRINGDVFLGVRLEDAVNPGVIATVQQSFSEMMIEETRLRVEVYCGVCSFPQDGRTPADLLESAQTALRFAKQGEDDGVVVYSDELKGALRREAHVLDLLSQAIELRTLEVWFQPIMDMHSKKFETAEALLRLKDENGEYLPAGMVIEAAEKNRMIEHVGAYVLEYVASFAAAHEGELDVKSFAVNLSAQEFMLEDCAETVLSRVRKSGAKPETLALEVTETVLIESFDHIVPTLERLREMGFDVVLDDFGTGFSSLNYYSAMPIDTLKIDRALTQRVMESEKQVALLKTIVDMARINDTTVVAEGVETAEEAAIIERIGVDRVQGFYFSRPIPPEQFLELVSRSS